MVRIPKDNQWNFLNLAFGKRHSEAEDLFKMIKY